MRDRVVADGRLEKLIMGLSSYLLSKVNALGPEKHGLERDDLLQEIRIRIWKALKEGGRHNVSYFDAYVKKIIKSVYYNEINKINKEHKALEMGREGLIPADITNGGILEADLSLKSVLAEALDGLSDPAQIVIKLRLDGFTFVQIAQINKWSLGKTHSVYYRSLRSLKHRLRKSGIHLED